MLALSAFVGLLDACIRAYHFSIKIKSIFTDFRSNKKVVAHLFPDFVLVCESGS